MIKGKKIESSSIKVIIPIKSIKNDKVKLPQQPSQAPTINISTQEIKEDQLNQQQPIHIDKIQLKNISNQSKQSKSTIQSKKMPSNQIYPPENIQTNKQLTLVSNQRFYPNKLKNAQPKVQNQIHAKKSSNSSSQKISKSVIQKQINSKVSSKIQPKSFHENKNVSSKKINSQQLIQPLKNVQNEQEKGTFIKVQFRNIQYQSQEQSQQIERQYVVNPIQDQLLEEELLITQKSSEQKNVEEPWNNYSFFPQEQEQCKEQDEKLMINMELFQLSADELLKLDYFTI